jgi:hypothetical protein
MLRDWRTGWMDKRHPKIKAMMQQYLEHTHGRIHLAKIKQLEKHKTIYLRNQNMYISLDASSYAGQAISENVGIGTAGSARKVDTPYRGTSQRSLPIKSLMSSAKGSFPPALKGGGVPPKKHKGDGAQH